MSDFGTMITINRKDNHQLDIDDKNKIENYIKELREPRKTPENMI